MGACNIEFIINKKASFSEIKRVFKEKQADDQGENGHQYGYSGDFQTVDQVKDHTHKIFNSYDEAEEYCLEHAEKWENVIAVYYKTKVKDNKKIIELKQKIEQIRTNNILLKKQLINNLKNAKSKTIKCKHCESTVNRKYILPDSYCPVCREIELLSETDKKRLLSAENKLKLLEDKLKIELDKNQEKSTEIRTLVCGWGAC